MTHRKTLAAFLLLTSLAALVGPAVAGHVSVTYDPCREGDPIGITTPFTECRPRDPRCGERAAEDPFLPPCLPQSANSQCLGYGLWAEVGPGVAHDENSRVAVSSYNAPASSRASLQNVSSLGLVRAGALDASCEVDDECTTEGTASAAYVELLGGLVVARGLHSRVALSCYKPPVVQTTFTNLVVGGVDLGPIVHPSRVHVPGVGTLVVGETRGPWFDGYAYHATATALRLEIEDIGGNVVGVVLVSDVQVASRYG